MSLKRRTPLKRSAFKREPHQVPRKPPKRHQVPDEVKSAVRRRSGGTCEASIPQAGCAKLARHLHHRKMRSAGGDDTEENLLHVCWKCHHYIHHAGQESYDQGWLVRSWQ